MTPGLYPIIRRQRIPVADASPIAPEAAPPGDLPANPAPLPLAASQHLPVSPAEIPQAPPQPPPPPVPQDSAPIILPSPWVPGAPTLLVPPALPTIHPPPSAPLVGPLASYFKFGALHGCPADQIRHFCKARVVLQAKQLAASAAARLCDRPEGPTAIGFGGARGGGKSFWLLSQMALDDCQRFPGLKCLLLRKVGKSNLESFEDLRRRLLTRLPHAFSASRGLLTFPNGSRIVLGHYQCEKDIDAYLGLEYDVIGLEEATTLNSRKAHDIVTCCRTSKLGWRPRIYSTTNPGGVGHGWYRTTYVTPFQQRAETGTRFIPATINDNAFTNPDYRHTLDNLTGWQKRAWRDGDWDIAAGQFFTNFRREVHVVDDFDLNRAVTWFAALDYGFTHYTVVLLGCEDGDGNFLIVDEHAARSWVPETHAAAIKTMFARYHITLTPRWSYSITLRRFVAGADVFARQSNGSTIAQQYADLGITLRPANTDRVNGWAEILKRLGDSAASAHPSLFIHRRCTRLIDTLPALQHDPNRPEDVLKTDPDEHGLGGDDAADALRYLLASKVPVLRLEKLGGL